MGAFTGTGTLLRLALRRDRIQLPIWTVTIVGIIAATIPALKDLYGTPEQLIQYATMMSQSVVTRMFGGPMDGANIGSVLMMEIYFFISVMIAFMSTFAVVRHTRQNEETGRGELIGSMIVGRHATLSAALLLVLGVNVVVALLIAVVLISNGFDVGSSLAMATSLGGIGLVFAAVAAISAQVAGSTRLANSLAGLVIATAVILRSAGDGLGTVAANGMSSVSAWPSWLSPIGWGQQIHPFAQNNYWILVLFPVVTAILVILAFVLTTHRDVGLGMLSVKRGPAVARRSLLSPLGLVWRLQRTSLIGWSIAVAIVGIIYGAIAVEFKSFVMNNESLVAMLQQLAGANGNITDMYFSAMLGMIAVAIAGYGLQSILRIKTEESEGRLEPLLATAVGRSGFLASHLTFTISGVLLLTLVSGMSICVGYGLMADISVSEVVRIISAAFVYLPAVLVIVGIAVALFGVLPRIAIPLSWALYLVCLIFSYLGETIQLPKWLIDISPFAYTPPAPASSVAVLPLLIMGAIAVLLILFSFVAFRRRDTTNA